MTEQSLMSRISTKILPAFSKRVFPAEWIEAGQDRSRLEAIAKKRRFFDGPRPDLILHRSWNSATTEISGRELRLLTPKSGSTGGVLFYCHGGAFVVGPSLLEWLHAARFAASMGLDLALYDYPKVPEYDSSTIRATTLQAYDRIAERYPSDRIVIAGLSAGGGLAMSTMLQLHRDNRTLPTAAALFSPWLDMTVSHPEARDYVESDQLLPIQNLRHDGLLYAGEIGAADPIVSPRFMTRDELSAMAPTVITAGDQEILLPESQELVNKLQEAGVSSSLHIESYGQHAGVMANTPEAAAVLEAATSELRRMMTRVQRR